MAAALRAATGYFLADHPRRTDAQTIINEFATTALTEHGCTCCPHDHITLTVDRDKHRLRLEISYHLALSHTPEWRTDRYEDPISTYRMSLAIINAHLHRPADNWGHMVGGLDGPDRFADLDQTWWADLRHARGNHA